MDRRQRVVSQSEPVHRARLEVLADDVEAPGKVDEELLASGVLEVDAHRSLVEVVSEEGCADLPTIGVGHRGERATSGLARDGVFDLDDLRSQARQQLCRVRERLHLFRREDSHSIEWLAELLSLAVGHVPESHGAERRRRAAGLHLHELECGRRADAEAGPGLLSHPADERLWVLARGSFGERREVTGMLSERRDASVDCRGRVDPVRSER